MGYFLLGIWITVLSCGWFVTMGKADFVDREERGLFLFLSLLMVITSMSIGVHFGALGVLNTM